MFETVHVEAANDNLTPMTTHTLLNFLLVIMSSVMLLPNGDTEEDDRNYIYIYIFIKKKIRNKHHRSIEQR